MRGFTLYLFLIAFSVSCGNSRKGPHYRITGQIKGLSEGSVYLSSKDFKDTSLVENGVFMFSGSLPEPILCAIGFEGYENAREFYIENSEIEFAGRIDSLEKARVTGSKTEEERAAYQALMSGFDQEFADLEKEYVTADAAKRAQLDVLYEQIELRQVDAQKQFIRQNPASFLSIRILTDIDWSFNSACEYDEYLSLLAPSLSHYQGTAYLKNLVERMRNVEPGQIAPDFEMSDNHGTPVRLSEMYPRSELLLLDFWASTCGPCRTENANLREAYDLYKDKGLEILGVSTDTRKEYWLEAIEKDGLIWKNVCSLKDWGENEVVTAYALRQVSQNFLLDQNGIILARDLRGELLFSKLDELLD